MAAKPRSSVNQVQFKTCRHCIEDWIAAWRAADTAGTSRAKVTVACRYHHLCGTVVPHDEEFSRGRFPVCFEDGVTRIVMASDLREVNDPPALVAVADIPAQQVVSVDAVPVAADVA